LRLRLRGEEGLRLRWGRTFEVGGSKFEAWGGLRLEAKKEVEAEAKG